MTNWMTAAVNLGVLLAVIGSVMFVADIGANQTWEVISGDDGNVSHATYLALGQTDNATDPGDVDVIDRLVVGTIALTILTGFGVLGYSSRDPKAMKLVLQYYPLLGLTIGLAEFGSEMSDMFQGEYDFSTHSDGQNALHIAVAGWIMSGIAKLIPKRR